MEKEKQLRVVWMVLFLLCSAELFPQTVIHGLVTDSLTNKPLPYCNIAIKHTKKGNITNGEGRFSVSVNLLKDTVLFSYLGYNTKAIPALKLSQDEKVFMIPQEVLLQEFAVYANDDPLYEVLIQCKKNIQRNRERHVSKVYFGIEAQSKEIPLELLECYYNGYLKGLVVENLLFKAGRVGLAPVDSHYFSNRYTSKVFSSINLVKKNDYFPSVIFQFNKREMKRKYIARLISKDEDIYRIAFRPRNDSNIYFSGEVWIDGKDYSLQKIRLSIGKTLVHPFLPMFSSDSVYNVSFNLCQTYKPDDNHVMLPNHIEFNYNMTYQSVRDTTFRFPCIITRGISANGILYFYDYDEPFILPYFDYNADLDDYRKMSIFPYNDDFWNNNNSLLLTNRQKKSLGFFTHEGSLMNFTTGNYGNNFIHSFFNAKAGLFENYYVFWAQDKRIVLKKDIIQNEECSPEKVNQSIKSDLYNLKVQILLDVNPVGDSLSCKSYTVFDTFKTFFHLPERPYITSVFLNLYFDICEIERRKMETSLNSHSYTLSQIDSIYQSTLASMDNITKRYLDDVEIGENEKQVKKWNDYVKDHLGIDNITMYRKAEEREGNTKENIREKIKYPQE